MIVSWFFFKY